MRATFALLAAGALAAAAPGQAGELAGFAARTAGGTVLVEAAAAAGARTGTGFFLPRRGLVATALHTVEGARRVKVSIPGTFAVSEARLLAASSVLDLAVLAVPWPQDVPFPHLEFDGSGSLPPGTEVAATGYAVLRQGMQPVPLTMRGIVSGHLPQRGQEAYILDLAAGSGMSGAPVYRTDTGSVLAIVTRVLAPEDGRGPAMAVPVGALERLLRDIP